MHSAESACGGALPFGGPVGLTIRRSTPVEILSVHLWPERAAAGRRAYAVWLVERSRSLTHPLLVAGDANFDPTGWWDRVSSVFTDDVVFDQRTDVLLASGLGQDAGERGPATAVFSRRLDRIFVPPEITPVEYRVLYGHRRGRMDHRPVLLRLRVAG